MLILGLESATAQVGCAIGGHEGDVERDARPPVAHPLRDALDQPQRCLDPPRSVVPLAATKGCWPRRIRPGASAMPRT